MSLMVGVWIMCPWCVLIRVQEPLHTHASQLLAILCLVDAVHANHFQCNSRQYVVQVLMKALRFDREAEL